MTNLKDAIQNYCVSTFELADCLASSTEARGSLITITGLPPGRVDWLRKIAQVKQRDGILPESAYEISCSPTPDFWVEEALEKGLNSLEIRKAVRASQQTIATDKPILIATWLRHLMAAETELKRLDQVDCELLRTRVAALQHVLAVLEEKARQLPKIKKTFDRFFEL